MAEERRRLTILLAEDHTLVRDGTRQILEQCDDFKVVGETDRGDTAVELARRLEPDVVILDVRMPNLNGIEAARRIVAQRPASRVLIVSAYDDQQYVLEALRVGAAGYLLKTAPSAELVSAVRAVASGATVLQESISRRLALRSDDRASSSLEPSRRELEILHEVAAGKPNKEIARDLRISTRTVEGHLNNLFAKLGASSRTEALVVAMNRHLISLEDG
jgi:DNA-binding NarL/FixJ family response regulator